MERIGVLFVCTGNICRSPTAQGVFESLVKQRQLSHRFLIDSAGISSSHVGSAPDPRSQQIAKARGVDLSKQRARKVKPDDFQRFHYLIAMDDSHYEVLNRLRNEAGESESRVHLLLEFSPQLGLTEVPDPYYGPINGFQRVFDVVETGCQQLLRDLIARHGL